jgi:hypothetical protein
MQELKRTLYFWTPLCIIAVSGASVLSTDLPPVPDNGNFSSSSVTTPIWAERHASGLYTGP